MPHKRPARFRIDPLGIERVRERMLSQLVEVGAIIAVNEIKRQMTDAPARTGHQYRVPGTFTVYTASAPGEPPAVVEGRYVSSWKSTPAVRTGTAVEAFAYSDLVTENGEYLIGDLLEHGTVNMEPRPHIRPALPIIQRKVNELAQELFE